MKGKYYIYNIAFFHSRGNGSCQLVRKNKINSFAEFRDAKEFIEKENGFENVAIINFQLIGKTNTWGKEQE